MSQGVRKILSLFILAIFFLNINLLNIKVLAMPNSYVQAVEVEHFSSGDVVLIKLTRPVQWHKIRAANNLIIDLIGAAYQEQSKVKLILKGLIKVVRIMQLPNQDITRVIISLNRKDVDERLDLVRDGLKIRLNLPIEEIKKQQNILAKNIEKESKENEKLIDNKSKKVINQIKITKNENKVNDNKVAKNVSKDNGKTQNNVKKEVKENSVSKVKNVQLTKRPSLQYLLKKLAEAKILYNQSKYEDVIEMLTTLEEDFPTSVHLKELLAKSYLKLARYDKAIAELEDLLKLKPSKEYRNLLFFAVKKNKKPLLTVAAKDKPLAQVLEEMLTDYPYQIEVDENANIPVTVKFNNLTLQEALKRLVLDNGLAYKVEGNTIKVFLPIEKYDKFVAKLEMREVPLLGAIEALAKMMGKNVILDASVMGENSKKTTLFIEDKLSIEDIFDIILRANDLEKIKYNENTFIIVKKGQNKDKYLNRYVRIYRLKGGEDTEGLGSNEETVQLLNTLLQDMKITDKELKLTFDKRTNTLVAYGTEDKLKILDKLVAKLDKKVGQVVIAMRVMEISREAKNALGVSLKNLSQSTGSSVPTLNSGGVFPIDIKTIGQISLTKLDATIDLLENKNYVKTIASPILRTINKQQANIHIGKEVPVKMEKLNPIYEGGKVVGYATETEWQTANIGIEMNITPIIHNDKEVTLKIQFDISDADLTNVEIGGHFVKSSRKIDTIVRLKSGETIMLGGLMRRQEGNQKYKLPFFSKLPLIGKFFKYKTNNYSKSELVILLTAFVVGMDDEKKEGSSFDGKFAANTY